VGEDDGGGGDGRGGEAGARDPEAEGGDRGGGRRGDAEEQAGLRRVRDGQGRRALHAVVDSGRRRPRQVFTPTYPPAVILMHHILRLQFLLYPGPCCWNGGARLKFMACLFCR
jgi:hypothetical protein